MNGQQPHPRGAASPTPVSQPDLPQYATVELAELDEVSPRTVWLNEERNFTPWLSDKIERLSRLLGLDLEVVETERRIGAYELDIYARDRNSDANVIIENQLE